MDVVVLLLGPILFIIGAWTVTHPNGGYRAVGGAGSALSSRVRQFYGGVFILLGLVVMFAPVPT